LIPNRRATELTRHSPGSVFGGLAERRKFVLSDRIFLQLRATRQQTPLFGYNPAYSSWLNQVEIWFSKLMRYIRNDNKTATPIRWTYKNVGHRIAPVAI
jgi:DDE superfamily endonuclease